MGEPKSFVITTLAVANNTDCERVVVLATIVVKALTEFEVEGSGGGSTVIVAGA